MYNSYAKYQQMRNRQTSWLVKLQNLNDPLEHFFDLKILEFLEI